MNKDIAKEHRISQSVVSRVVGKALKNPKFLQELISERDLKIKAREHIVDVVTKMNQREEFIDSAAHVQKEIKKEGEQTVKSYVVRDVLRKDLGMRYKKINPIAWTANSNRNLILR